MEAARTLELSCALAAPAGRAAAAAALARHLGAEGLMLFVRDPELKAFLPAPGLPQTIPGGPGWLELLRRCEAPGRHTATVAYPDRTSVRDALAISTDEGVAFVLLGGRPRLDHERELCLPLLAAALKAEIAVEAAHGREVVARDAARHAAALTAALDATRTELERLNAELKTADRTKDEFLAMLAHELRNPLSPIVSALELLRKDAPGGPPQAKILEIIARQARHLTRLVDDLLDVARISRGQISLRREPVDVRAALQQAVESVRPLLERERHALEISVPDAPVYVLADPVRLNQIIANLLTNAAKYTNPGGRIAASVSAAPGQAEVKIRDSGIGIEKEMLSRVFDLFVQAPRALDRAGGGLGIGLTLVRRLVGLHDGSIEVSSEGAGKGSEFVVRLPTTDQRPAAPPPKPENAPAGRRVLVVEDNLDSAEMLGEMLRIEGFAVHVANDGEAGVAAALEFAPEVVLLDIGLPKMDGYAVARALRRRLPEAVLVAFSGYGDEEHRLRSRAAGFDAHLVKPLELGELLPILRATRASAASARAT